MRKGVAPDPATMVQVSCPLCEARSSAPVYPVVDALSLEYFQIVRCRGCGLAYVDPRPDDAHLGRYYPDDTYYSERHPFFKDELMGLRVRALGPPLPSGRRLLDYGCGRGDFVLAARKRGWDACGAEMAASPVMGLRERLGIEVFEIEEVASLADESFDAITLWHVFEHTPSPRAVLAELRRLLRSDGRLLIEVPNFGGWLGRLAGRTWYHAEVPRHLVHFDRANLLRILESEGFCVDSVGTFSLEYDLFGLLQGWLNRICDAPNHLYQVLIGEPTVGGRRDTILSFVLGVPLGVAAGLVAVVAPLFGQGGVLRVIAHKAQRPEAR